MLGVVEGLHHGQQSRPRVSLLVHACQVVVQLNDTLLVHLGDLVHHPLEPLERPRLPRDPVEVGAGRSVRPPLVAAARRRRAQVAGAVLGPAGLHCQVLKWKKKVQTRK